MNAALYPPVDVAQHRFQLLTTGAQALAALEAIIRHAERSVCLEMYIFKADATGRRMLDALMQACRRGVRVRILLDDFGSAELPRVFFAEAIKCGAELRFFNASRTLRAAFRNHRKLCVVDHRVAIVGGFNVGDDYDGDGVHGGWRDLGLQLQGPLVDELETTFSRMYLAGRADTRAVVAFARGLRARQIMLDRPMLLTSGPGFDGGNLRKVLYRDFWTARRVAIIAAYFTPPWRLRRALRNTAKRGIVRLMLPGVSDVPLMRLAAQHLYERLLQHRVEIFEYQPQILHAKLVIVDDVVYVGSSNFDVRSLQLNFDFLLRIPSPVLAEQARRLFAADMAHSRAITLPEWHAAKSFWPRIVRLAAYWLVTRLDPFIAQRKWRALR